MYFFSSLYSFTKKHIATIGFITGFLWDTLTLQRIDLVYENIVFIFHLSLSLFAIFLIHGVATGKIQWAPLVKIKRWLPFFVQFPIGGLLSGFVIFYTKSASFMTSWPFLLFLVLLFFGNEFLTKRYEKLVFQLTIWYIALFSYLILIVPILLGEVGVFSFLLAGISSVFILIIAVRSIMHFFPHIYERAGVRLWLSLSSVFIFMNVLYFSHIMPPVPIALKDIGVYHNAIKKESTYELLGEEKEWWHFWRETNRILHIKEGDALYCFSSIFLPDVLHTEVQHIWSFKNNEGKWEKVSTIPFPIRGGREKGYRGYTIKQKMSDGLWRCSVETVRGQEIGRIVFEVRTLSETDDLSLFEKKLFIK
jgi:hypothetical protein